MVSWLARQWQNLIDWLNRLAAQHPIGFDIVTGVLVVALVVLLVHFGYVMWRIVQPSARTGQARPAVGAAVMVEARPQLDVDPLVQSRLRQ